MPPPLLLLLLLAEAEEADLASFNCITDGIRGRWAVWNPEFWEVPRRGRCSIISLYFVQFVSLEFVWLLSQLGFLARQKGCQEGRSWLLGLAQSRVVRGGWAWRDWWMGVWLVLVVQSLQSR